MDNIVITVDELGDLMELEAIKKVSEYAAWLQAHSNLSLEQIKKIKLAELKDIQKQVLAQTQEALSVPKANSES